MPESTALDSSWRTATTPATSPVRPPGKAAQPTCGPLGRGWLFGADLLAVLSVTLLVLALHRPAGIATWMEGRTYLAHAAVLVAFDLLLLLQLGRHRQYREGQRFCRSDDVVTLGRSAFVAASVTVFLAVLTDGFLLSPERYSHALLAAGTLLSTGAIVIIRLAAHRQQVRAFQDGRYLVRSLVIGGGPRSERFAGWLRARPHLGQRAVVSTVPPDAQLSSYMEALGSEIDAFEPDELVLALDEPRPRLRAAVVREAVYRNLSVKVLPEVFESYTDLPVAAYDGVPVTTVRQTSSDRFALAMKRTIDLLGSVAGLVLLAPMFAVIAIAIRLEDGGPVIYSQERVGERGRRFLVRKFRTMAMDAEQRQAQVAALNEADGPLFKVRDDPRVTRTGRLLRRFSLDEFPQLWNVACGEMSLIGPRPPLPSEVETYRPEHRRRLFVHPGMSGLWQVSGRSDTTFDEMVALDLMYIDNWSVWLDLRILLRTIRVVVARTGAY